MDSAKTKEEGSLLKLSDALSAYLGLGENGDLWTNINSIAAVNRSAKIDILVGKTYTELSELYSTYTNKSALIYAAEKGLPFAIDAPGSYGDLEVSQYQSDAIFDLMKMLAVKLDLNTRDSQEEANLNGIGDTWFFKPGHLTVTNIDMSDPFEPQKVAFGNSDGNTLTNNLNGAVSRLYGLGGNDNLYGGDKSDILDGGNEGDTLKGNGGIDLLIGGSGDDTLEGGPDKDILDGGPGNDTYLFDSQSGHDIIEKYNAFTLGDADGVIKYDNEVVDGSGAKKLSPNANIFYDKDNEIRYSLVDRTLTIEFEENHKVVSSVTIKDFVNGNLGINLPTDVEQPEDQTNEVVSIANIWAEKYQDCIASGSGSCKTLDEAMADIENSDLRLVRYYGLERSGDSYFVKENNLKIINDTVYGSHIEGGNGDDWIIGSEEKDYIEGSTVHVGDCWSRDG
jgi:hypothetical protein